MNRATMTGEGARYPKRGEYWDKFTGHAWAADTLIIRDYM